MALKDKLLKFEDLVEAEYETGKVFNSDDVKEAVKKFRNYLIILKDNPEFEDREFPKQLFNQYKKIFGDFK